MASRGASFVHASVHDYIALLALLLKVSGPTGTVKIACSMPHCAQSQLPEARLQSMEVSHELCLLWGHGEWYFPLACSKRSS
ncbi:hypothetical protein B0H65DRAFT_466212 [Neurospora tetraspora]|uniref:Uncharacterized protein n=1 Tax=Neurospora tetraspora TaxID=94610 RepID=A0AAE0MRT0_9PEZI|nr:hypothetical protein B0H65DRAFT_466212 [Neurospora tetraspora]